MGGHLRVANVPASWCKSPSGLARELRLFYLPSRSGEWRVLLFTNKSILKHRVMHPPSLSPCVCTTVITRVISRQIKCSFTLSRTHHGEWNGIGEGDILFFIGISSRGWGRGGRENLLLATLLNATTAHRALLAGSSLSLFQGSGGN